MRFQFATAGNIVFGAGVARDAGKLTSPLGRHALVVTGRDAQRAGFLMDALGQNGVGATAFSVTEEPSVKVVEDGVATARKAGCDLVVSIGGGSALDTGKAIAAMLTNPGAVMDYLEVIGGGKALTKDSAPFIAIPTTAGTGSEVTRNAVLASAEHRVKVSLRSASMLAKIAIVDPELTYDLPPAITASTGLDALTQVIEPFVSCRANPMTDAICVEGMKRASRSLRTAFENGADHAAREDMCVASLFGGLALANAGLGAVHGFAGVIGGMFGAAHGAICAALLPHVMEANIRALRKRDRDGEALRRYECVGLFLCRKQMATAEDGVGWVRQLVLDLKIPGLRKCGVQTSDMEEVIEKSAKASSMKANPIVLTAEELRWILERAMGE
jgi:alcohol dehydrogenase class IV